MDWIYLAVAIVTEVVATTALKASEGFTKLVPSAIVVVGYGIAFYCLSLTMKAIPVGIIYAIWSGVGVALICLTAWVLFGQRLDLPAMLGIALIISGVLVINIFSNVSAH